MELKSVRERTLLAQRFDDRSGRLEGDASPIAENVDYYSPIGIAGFSVSSTGVLAYHASDSIGQITWITRAGVQTGTVAAPAGYQNIRLSPDGKRLAFDRSEQRTNATDVHQGHAADRHGVRLLDKTLVISSAARQDFIHTRRAR